MSVKFQITLPEALLAQMKRGAEERGVSVAEFIRQTMEDQLGRHTRKAHTDPFASITGLVDSEEIDLASQIDQVLYR